MAQMEKLRQRVKGHVQVLTKVGGEAKGLPQSPGEARPLVPEFPLGCSWFPDRTG